MLDSFGGPRMATVEEGLESTGVGTPAEQGSEKLSILTRIITSSRHEFHTFLVSFPFLVTRITTDRGGKGQLQTEKQGRSSTLENGFRRSGASTLGLVSCNGRKREGTKEGGHGGSGLSVLNGARASDRVAVCNVRDLVCKHPGELALRFGDGEQACMDNDDAVGHCKRVQTRVLAHAYGNALTARLLVGGRRQTVHKVLQVGLELWFVISHSIRDDLILDFGPGLPQSPFVLLSNKGVRRSDGSEVR